MWRGGITTKSQRNAKKFALTLHAGKEDEMRVKMALKWTKIVDKRWKEVKLMRSLEKCTENIE